MKTAAQLRAERAYVAALLVSIHERMSVEPTDETRAQHDADGESFRAGSEFMTTTKPELEQLEARETQIEELRTLAQNPAHIERGAPTADDARKTVNVNRNSNPFDGDIRRADTAELTERALAVVADHSDYAGVTPERQEATTKLLKRWDVESDSAREIAAHILTTGSPEYARAFREYMRTPAFGPPPELRAAMTTTDANGGVMIPQWLDPTINLTNAGTNNVIDQLVDIVPITSNIWEGVTSAGVTAAMLAEGAEVTDNTPTFEGPTITANKAAAYLFASYEVLQDTGFDEVGMLFEDAKSRLEETQLTTGNGTAGNCTGLITALSGTGPSFAGTSGAAGAADFVIGDVYGTKNALGPRFRRNANWMANPAILDRIRQFGNAAAGSNAANFWVDLGADVPSVLLGKGAYENEAMDSTIVSGSNDDILLFGDFKQYKHIVRVGMSIMYNPLVISTGSGRPTGQAGWFGFWRFGGNVITSNGFKLLRV